VKQTTRTAVRKVLIKRASPASSARVEALERLRVEVETAHAEGTWYAREPRVVAILKELKAIS